MLLEGEKRDEAESFRGEQQTYGHQGNRATESETKGLVHALAKDRVLRFLTGAAVGKVKLESGMVTPIYSKTSWCPLPGM